MKLIKTMMAITAILCCTSFTKTSHKKMIVKDNNLISWTYEGRFYDPGIGGYLYVWCNYDDQRVVQYGTYSRSVNPHYPATGSYNVNTQIVTGFYMKGVAGTPYTGPLTP